MITDNTYIMDNSTIEDRIALVESIRCDWQEFRVNSIILGLPPDFSDERLQSLSGVIEDLKRLRELSKPNIKRSKIVLFGISIRRRRKIVLLRMLRFIGIKIFRGL